LALEGANPAFATIVASQVVMGVAYTFVEGALEAWLADEIGEERFGAALLRGGQIGGVAGFVGIGAAVAAASVHLALPLLLGGALMAALAAYLVAAMGETGFHRPPRAEAVAVRARVGAALGEMGTTTRAGARVVRGRPLALTILVVAAIFGGHTEGFDRLWQAHFLEEIGLPSAGRFDPVVWFGAIQAATMLLGIGAAEVLRRRVPLDRPAVAIRALFAFEATLAVGVVAFGLAVGFAPALAAYLVASVARALVAPVYTAWINRGVDPKVRATVLSMSGQADALGQFTVGPGLGLVGNAFGLRTAMAVAGLALSPAVWLYGRAARRTAEGEPAAAADPAAPSP
jgi:DHA3 family tetracycline resistance protein-like MFS transporter